MGYAWLVTLKLAANDAQSYLKKDLR